MFQQNKVFNKKAFSLLEILVGLIIITLFLTSIFNIYTNAINRLFDINIIDNANRIMAQSYEYMLNGDRIRIYVQDKSKNNIENIDSVFLKLSDDKTHLIPSLYNRKISIDECMNTASEQFIIEESTGSELPYQPICSQIFLKKLRNTQDIYCFGVYVVSKQSNLKEYTKTTVNIINGNFDLTENTSAKGRNFIPSDINTENCNLN